ncbi:MAG: hypothetical protein QXM16_08190 [Nitrososphaerota archaeon]
MIEEVIRSIGDSLRDDGYFAALIATLTLLWIEQRRAVGLLEKNICLEDFFILPGIVALIVIKYLLPWLVNLI